MVNMCKQKTIAMGRHRVELANAKNTYSARQSIQSTIATKKRINNRLHSKNQQRQDALKSA